MERRDFFRLGAIGLVTMGDVLRRMEAAAAAPVAPALDPDAALQKLLAGNQRFVRQQPQYPDQTQARLKEVAQAQAPFATILSCADSRVPPEIIFDQGIGDIFDIRIAGNIATPAAIGSIEYAVALLNSPLLLVLGHERCGAVTAAVKNEPLPGEISTFVKAILPGITTVKGQSSQAIDEAVIANVRYQIGQLQRSTLLSDRLQSGKLKISGGRYDLDSGRVDIIV